MEANKEMEKFENVKSFDLESLQERFEASYDNSLLYDDVELNESIEFSAKANNPDSLKGIQVYFAMLGMLAQKSNAGVFDPSHGNCFEFTCELSIYGENGYVTKDLDDFINGMINDIQDAEGFRIITNYTGMPTSCLYERILFGSDSANIPIPYENIILPSEGEKYTYKYWSERHFDGFISCGKYVDGKYVGLEKLYSEDIVEKEFPEYEWLAFDFTMVVNHDKDKHPELDVNIKNCVRSHFSGDTLKYCEENWKDIEEDCELDDFYYVFRGMSLNPKNLKAFQEFLDDLNSIIEPVKDDCGCDAEGEFYIMKHPFGVATIKRTDKGFKVVGTEM